jgi:hypothetical protein
MSKNSVFVRDIICVYHPEFNKAGPAREFVLKDPNRLNVELLIEETLAAVGPYDFVDAAGYDFSDFSDSKTTSINQKTGVGTVSSVETKIGALRITAYNPLKDAVDYFFVPQSHLNRVRQPCYGNNSHKERILFTYSSRYEDNYGWFENYRVKTFEDLALAK